MKKSIDRFSTKFFAANSSHTVVVLLLLICISLQPPPGGVIFSSACQLDVNGQPIKPCRTGDDVIFSTINTAGSDKLSSESAVDQSSCIFQSIGSSSLIDCSCNAEHVDSFNNDRFFPALQNLLQKNYFRYYRVNMDKPCPMWKEERECTSKECGVKNCDDEVPAGLRIFQHVVTPNQSGEVVFQKDELKKDPKHSNQHETDVNGDDDDDEQCKQETNTDTGNKLDPLDTHISTWQKEQFLKWDLHDDSQDRFCDVDDERSADMHYVDLQLNPERYTGYKGDSATRVWKSIYEENCFKPDPKYDKGFLLHPTITGLCLEKRVFYRLISGLHTSITISIAAHNYKPALHSFGKGEWVRNVEMFKNRFLHPKDSKGEGRERLKNLYFVYLVELRALQKIAPYLNNDQFFTGDQTDDQETRQLVRSLLDLTSQFKYHFDESVMFRDVEALARALKEEFRRHFINISRIMDCVGCDKCRLWGKLQTHGIGTALKILFTDIPASGKNRKNPEEPVSSSLLLPDYSKFHLQRNDVVALLNSLGRFASSIVEINEFTRLLREENEKTRSSSSSELK